MVRGDRNIFRAGRAGCFTDGANTRVHCVYLNGEAGSEFTLYHS